MISLGELLQWRKRRGTSSYHLGGGRREKSRYGNVDFEPVCPRLCLGVCVGGGVSVAMCHCLCRCMSLESTGINRLSVPGGRV